MLILLHGGNTFASLQALDKLIADKPEVTVVDGGEVAGIGELLKNQDTFSLFDNAVSKTMVIKRLNSNSKKKLATELVAELEHKNLTNLNLIFWEDEALGARDKLLGFIKKNGEVKVFAQGDTGGLTKWLVASAAETGIKLSPQLANNMVFRVGTEQQLLASELQKLVLYIKAENRNEVEKQDLEVLAINEQESSIWELTDALAVRNRVKILGLANKIMQTDQDFHQVLLPMIARQIKILFLAKQFPAPQLKKDFKLHPFVVKKALQQAHNFETAQLKQIFNKLVTLDYAVKQGKIEPRLGLNLLLATI